MGKKYSTIEFLKYVPASEKLNNTITFTKYRKGPGMTLLIYQLKKCHYNIATHYKTLCGKARYFISTCLQWRIYLHIPNSISNSYYLPTGFGRCHNSKTRFWCVLTPVNRPLIFFKELVRRYFYRYVISA